MGKFLTKKERIPHEREVLIQKTILGRTDWRKIPRGDQSNNDCARIIDTGFNGGALCCFNWIYRYKEYLRGISAQIPKMHKSVGRELKFVFLKSIVDRFLARYHFTKLGVNFDGLEYD